MKGRPNMDVRDGEPCWAVQRMLNGEWVALGYWPLTTAGEGEARAYYDRCCQGSTIPLRILPLPGDQR